MDKVLNPAFVLMMAANAVMPPFGTEFRKAFRKQNQN